MRTLLSALTLCAALAITLGGCENGPLGLWEAITGGESSSRVAGETDTLYVDPGSGLHECFSPGHAYPVNSDVGRWVQWSDMTRAPVLRPGRVEMWRFAVLGRPEGGSCVPTWAVEADSVRQVFYVLSRYLEFRLTGPDVYDAACSIAAARGDSILTASYPRDGRIRIALPISGHDEADGIPGRLPAAWGTCSLCCPPGRVRVVPVACRA